MPAPFHQENRADRAAAPRFDRKFIEDHKLIERYLENKLPFKGARDLENWCRAHPDYLNELKLSERAHASLKLLEASGQPQDLRRTEAALVEEHLRADRLGVRRLRQPGRPSGSLLGKYDAAAAASSRTPSASMNQGSAGAARDRERDVHHSGSRARHRPGADHGEPHRAAADGCAHRLGYTKKLMQFRMFVDKQDQGRALVLNNLLKDSNGELRLTFNSTGLAAGIYTVRIEALPPRGIPIPDRLADARSAAERRAAARARRYSSRSVTMGGVLTTLRVASVPLTPTRTCRTPDPRPTPRDRA